MAMSRQHWYTVEEYHKIEEENPDCKFEYVNGEVRTMASGPFEHTKVVVNLLTILNSHLEDRVCQVVGSGMHVLPTGHDNLSYLPDITVACNPEDCHPDATAIRYPLLIVEVLSQSTEIIDRTEKLRAYQACPSM
jgi:Uma2 family endonuclease